MTSTKIVLALAILGGLIVGTYAFLETARSHRLRAPIPEAIARSALAREVGVAEELGFSPVGEVEFQLQGQPSGRSVELSAGECVAVVVSYWGWHRPWKLALARSCETSRTSPLFYPAGVSEQWVPDGVVGHVQWCAEHAETLRVCTESRAPAHRSNEYQRDLHRVRLVELRAPASTVGGRERLNRGFLLR